MANYLYFVKTRDAELKFGSGTGNRVGQIVRVTDGELIAQIDCGAYSALSIENHLKGVFAATRIWSRRGEFDGSTELWPLKLAGQMEAYARRCLKQAQEDKDYKAPEASDSVVELIQELIRAMPAYSQLSILDLCAGDGRLTNALADDGATVHQVEVDPPLNTEAPVEACMHVGDMLKLRDGQFSSDVVVMNPPFSDRKETGSKTSSNHYWKFVRKAKKHVAPGGCLIFIAPQTWESAIAKEDQDGTYEVLVADADFGPKHPNAAIIRWTAGVYAVQGGRDSRKLAMPAFDAEVLPTRRAAMEVPDGHWGVSQTFNLLQAGDTAAPRATLLRGPDAEACAKWIIEHKDVLTAWWGTAADGMKRLQTTQIKQLLGQ